MSQAWIVALEISNIKKMHWEKVCQLFLCRHTSKLIFFVFAGMNSHSILESHIGDKRMERREGREGNGEKGKGKKEREREINWREKRKERTLLMHTNDEE